MSESCTVAGDGDLYGLGVRLGLYLQWLAGFLLRNFDGSWKTISSVRTANNAVSSALNLTVIINTSIGNGLSLNYPIVYYLTVALFYSESYNLMHKDNPDNKGYKYKLKPDAPLVVQNIIFASTTLFGTWFWLRGVFDTQPPKCGEAKFALIGLFNLQDDRWRHFATSLSIIAGLILVLVLYLHTKQFLSKMNLGAPVTRDSMIELAYMLRHLSGPAPGTLVRLLRPRLTWKNIPDLVLSTFHWFIINLAGPLIAVVSVERTLIANHVSTASILDSSGQMIALLTGIMSLCMAVWDIYRTFFGKNSSIDLLSSHAYISRRPLDRKQMELALKNISEAVENYDERTNCDPSNQANEFFETMDRDGLASDPCVRGRQSTGLRTEAPGSNSDGVTTSDV